MYFTAELLRILGQLHAGAWCVMGRQQRLLIVWLIGGSAGAQGAGGLTRLRPAGHWN